MTLLDQIEHMKFAHTRCPASCHLYHHEVMTLCAKLREVVEAVTEHFHCVNIQTGAFLETEKKMLNVLTPMKEA